MSEFNWWLLIVGLVVGAGLVWLVLADSARREHEVTEAELPTEATWIAERLAESGQPIDPALAEDVLRLHRAYLATVPPEDPFVDPPPELESTPPPRPVPVADPPGEPSPGGRSDERPPERLESAG